MSDDIIENEGDAPETPEEAPEPELPVTPLFGKWDLSELVVADRGLARHLNLNAFRVPHTCGRHARRRFGKRNLTLVERLINNMMRTERYTGQKAQAYTVVRDAFNTIHEKTKQNPVQILVQAVENSAPRAETVSLRFGGIRVFSGVDVSPSRRLDLAMRHLCQGAIAGASRQRSIRKSLARELMLGAKNSADSFAVAKREEKERQAEAAH